MAPPRAAEPELVRIEVTADDAERRLDQLLAARIAGQTRSRLQRLIREGRAHIGRGAREPDTGVAEPRDGGGSGAAGGVRGVQ